MFATLLRTFAVEVCLTRPDSAVTIKERMTRPAHLAFLQCLPQRGLDSSIAQDSKIRVGSRFARPFKIYQVLKQGANRARVTSLLGWVSKLRQGQKGMLPRLRSRAFKQNRSRSLLPARASGFASRAAWCPQCWKASAPISTIELHWST